MQSISTTVLIYTLCRCIFNTVYCRWTTYTLLSQRVTRWLFNNIVSTRLALRHSQSLAQWLSMLCQISCVTLVILY